MHFSAQLLTGGMCHDFNRLVSALLSNAEAGDEIRHGTVAHRRAAARAGLVFGTNDVRRRAPQAFRHLPLALAHLSAAMQQERIESSSE
jgi:hypothetical protein